MKSIFKDRQQAFRCAQQAAFAKEIAQMRQHRHFKREKSEKVPYKPGESVLGLSAVSESIRKDCGHIASRQIRRKTAKTLVVAETHLSAAGLGGILPSAEPFKSFYNGDGPIRSPHNIKPSKYAGTRRAGRG